MTGRRPTKKLTYHGSCSVFICHGTIRLLSI